jgi:hypothetical protein
MKIEIKNLGAVKSATIDISKKLNLFCGPNGTGKTYVAYAIYDIFRSDFHIGTNEIFDNIVEELVKNKSVRYELNFDVINQYRKEIVSSFINDLDTLFGIGIDVTKQILGEVDLKFVEDNESLNDYIVRSNFEIIEPFGKIKIKISKEKETKYVFLELLDSPMPNIDIDRLRFFLYSRLVSILAKYPISSTFILPVERNSIYTFSKELSIRKQEAVDYFHAMTSKKKKETVIDMLLSNTKRYPLPIKDGLLIADDLAEKKKSKSPFFDFAEEIENSLLNGKLEIDNDGEIKFKPNKSPKKSLPIHMTASIVKSLSSLVVYLKYIAEPNDLIIIDEPEINLHPDNQIILTRLFAKLINKGFRFIISTHSDYIIREFNNLVMLSDNRLEKEAERFGYSKDEYIKQEDMEVLYFNYPDKKKGNKQVTVETLPIDETGFEVPSIDEVINIQNDIAEQLFYKLKYTDEEDE